MEVISPGTSLGCWLGPLGLSPASEGFTGFALVGTKGTTGPQELSRGPNPQRHGEGGIIHLVSLPKRRDSHSNGPGIMADTSMLELSTRSQTCGSTRQTFKYFWAKVKVWDRIEAKN